MPKIIPSKTTVATLRRFLGLGQKEFADLAGRSTPTIQAVELGKLPLSEKLGADISRASGVSMNWLMAGKPGSAPLNELNEPLTLSYFESVVAAYRKGKRPEKTMAQDAGDSLLTLHCVLAKVDGSDAEKIVLYRLEQFTKALRAEFGGCDVEDPQVNSMAARLREQTSEAYHSALNESSLVPAPSKPTKPQKKQPSRKSKRPA
jgi:hypothetical protein